MKLLPKEKYMNFTPSYNSKYMRKDDASREKGIAIGNHAPKETSL